MVTIDYVDYKPVDEVFDIIARNHISKVGGELHISCALFSESDRLRHLFSVVVDGGEFGEFGEIFDLIGKARASGWLAWAAGVLLNFDNVGDCDRLFDLLGVVVAERRLGEGRLVRTGTVGVSVETKTGVLNYNMGDFLWGGVWYVGSRNQYGAYITGCSGRYPTSERGGRILMSDGTYDYF